MFKFLNDCKIAMTNLQAKTGDSSLGSRVEQGKGQIVSVTYDDNGISVVKELSEWVPVSELIQTIENYSHT